MLVTLRGQRVNGGDFCILKVLWLIVVQTFSSSKVLVDVKFNDSCSFSFSKDLTLSADFSLYLKIKRKGYLFENMANGVWQFKSVSWCTTFNIFFFNLEVLDQANYLLQFSS